MLKHKSFNGWNLFWLIGVAISVAMLVAMSQTDMTSGPGVSSMIQISVRCAVPWLYLAFAASSLQLLFPGSASAWLLRNRKYLGLSFALAMAWQGFFILWLVIVYSDYYINEVYVMRDAIEGVLGYLFLTAMTITSFRFARRRIKGRTWALLHKSGIYYLWAYAFSVYWWALFYYDRPDWVDYVFYVSGFLACGLRTAAWGRSRHKAALRRAPGSTVRPAARLAGYSFIVFGLVIAATGSTWYPVTEQLLTGHAITRAPELYLPYWPFEPFFPVFFLVLGIRLTTSFEVQ